MQTRANVAWVARIPVESLWIESFERGAFFGPSATYIAIACVPEFLT
jgi:hypothetical protein